MPTGIYERSLEIRHKCRSNKNLFTKGINYSWSFDRGHIPWNKGKSCSDETKKKIGLANKGRKHSEEAKRKIAFASKGNKNNLGKKFSTEVRIKHSESQRGDRGSNWRGG